MADSARKHNVDDRDIAASMLDAHLRVALDDESPQRQLILGFDTNARLLEIVVLVFDDGREPIAIHVMKARKKYREMFWERS